MSTTELWIPIAERLPDDGQECWITRNGCVEWATFHALHPLFLTVGGPRIVCKLARSITAWMPINKPAPYAVSADSKEPAASPAKAMKQSDPPRVAKKTGKSVQQPSSASVEPHNEDRQPGTAHHACYTD